MRIVGFASQLAMGKDTAADYLAIELNRVDTWAMGKMRFRRRCKKYFLQCV